MCSRISQFCDVAQNSFVVATKIEFFFFASFLDYLTEAQKLPFFVFDPLFNLLGFVCIDEQGFNYSSQHGRTSIVPTVFVSSIYLFDYANLTFVLLLLEPSRFEHLICSGLFAL